MGPGFWRIGALAATDDDYSGDNMHASEFVIEVLPEYRCNRIGFELPQAEVIRTGNASSNAPMLKINRELGFKPFSSRPIWQVETETAAKYLGETSASA